MENTMLKQLPNGKWEYLVDEAADMAVIAATREEAERMAAAYRGGDTSVARKRIARQQTDRARTALLKD